MCARVLNKLYLKTNAKDKCIFQGCREQLIILHIINLKFSNNVEVICNMLKKVLGEQENTFDTRGRHNPHYTCSSVTM